ncbi:MAG: secondary thiamine-phosphate synthase enzyme YjbQ [Candidatus Aenigmatarchaeota archaeon]
MEIFQSGFEVKTSKRIEVIDITEEVEKTVERSGIKNGVCLIFIPHATASIVLEENEAGLIKDIENTIKKIFLNEKYEHDRIDNNAYAHIASGFIGQSRIYPIKDRKILRGKWQNTLLIELDGPRKRDVLITIIGK